MTEVVWLRDEGLLIRACSTRKQAERHPRLGKLRRVDMPNLIANVISHVGQTGARPSRLVCRGTPKFRAMVLSASSEVFAAHNGEITFSALVPRAI